MIKKKNTLKNTNQGGATKRDLKEFKEEILHQFHVISEELIDQIKLLAEGHAGIIERLIKMDGRLEGMEKENEREHLETRSLVRFLSLSWTEDFLISSHE
jgi:hypothetical protein